METVTAPRRGKKASKLSRKGSGARKVSFATTAEKFRGMLKNGPHDLSIREGLGR